MASLFSSTPSDEQTLHLLNSILVFYGAPPVSTAFFRRYLTPAAFSSVSAFEKHIKDYQKDAIRLFSNFKQAYTETNSADDALHLVLTPLEPLSLVAYRARSEWNTIAQIEAERLPDLGYVSAVRA